MFVSIMAFHAKISDPTIGGTFMTLLNTISNLGSVWPSTLMLWLVDPLTMKQCTGAVGQESNTCGSPDMVEVYNSYFVMDMIPNIKIQYFTKPFRVFDLIYIYGF